MRYIISVFILFILAGCAELDMPTPVEVMKKPLGTDAVKVGMTREQVDGLWGEPDYVKFEEDKSSKRKREVWVYKARYSSVPVDASYLSKTRYLYFDGNNLTKIGSDQ